MFCSHHWVIRILLSINRMNCQKDMNFYCHRIFVREGMVEWFDLCIYSIWDNLDMMHDQTPNLAHWLSKGFDLGWLCDALDNEIVPMFCLRRRTETMQDAELQRLGWCLDGLPCILSSHTTVDGGIVVRSPTVVWNRNNWIACRTLVFWFSATLAAQVLVFLVAATQRRIPLLVPWCHWKSNHL